MFGRKKEKKENQKKTKEKLETSKVVLFIVFLICIEILIYTQVVVLILRDSSALYTLAGVPVTLVPIILGYYWKARSQNIKGGITYDTAMAKLESKLGVANSVVLSNICDENAENEIGNEIDINETINELNNMNSEGDG